MDMSLIIPCHNLEKYITPLLESLNRQELNNHQVEIIFICDACSDKTREIIEQYKSTNLKQYSGINIFEINARSCGMARNYGLDRAIGDFIWFLDGDDWIIEEKAIHTLITEMRYLDDPILRFDYEAPNFQFYGHPSMVWQYCIKRDFIGDIRFLSIQPHEDLRFMGELSVNLKNKPQFLNRKLYHYNYMREGSNMYQMGMYGQITS